MTKKLNTAIEGVLTTIPGAWVERWSSNRFSNPNIVHEAMVANENLSTFIGEIPLFIALLVIGVLLFGVSCILRPELVWDMTIPALKIVSMALIIIVLSWAFRGYFWSKKTEEYRDVIQFFIRDMGLVKLPGKLDDISLMKRLAEYAKEVITIEKIQKKNAGLDLKKHERETLESILARAKQQSGAQVDELLEVANLVMEKPTTRRAVFLLAGSFPDP